MLSRLWAQITSVSLPVLAIALCGMLCLLIATQYSWPGTDGNGHARIISGDGQGYYLYLPALFLDGNIGQQEPDNRFIFLHGSTGVNKYYSGTAVLMLPFFGLGHAIATAQGDAETGFSPPYQKAISLAGLFYLLAGLWFLVGLLRLYGICDAVIAVVVVLLVFGTNLLTYSVLSPAMSHVYSWFVIAGFVFHVKKLFVGQRSRSFYLATLFFGLVVLIRPLNGLVLLAVLPLAGSFGVLVATAKTIGPKRIAIGVLLLLAIASIQSLMWYLQTGSPIVWSYKGEGFYFTKPAIFNVLLSFRKGWFIYTPLALLAFGGLLPLWRRNRYSTLTLVLFFAVLIYCISAWWNWYYGPSFGQRPFVEFYPIIGLLLALLLAAATGWKRWLVGLLCVLCVGLNLVQNHQYQHGILSSWNMNFEKYAYVFLKTTPEYKGVLGGANDLLPYQHHKSLIWEQHYAFEGPEPATGELALAQPENATSGVLDYRNREYNLAVNVPVDAAYIATRGLFAEVSLSRYELEAASASTAFFGYSLTDAAGHNYKYQAFPINETPSSTSNKWKTLSYRFEIAPLQSANDELKLFIWNKGQRPFYVDDLQIQLYRIADLE